MHMFELQWTKNLVVQEKGLHMYITCIMITMKKMDLKYAQLVTSTTCSRYRRRKKKKNIYIYIFF